MLCYDIVQIVNYISLYVPATSNSNFELELAVVGISDCWHVKGLGITAIWSLQTPLAHKKNNLMFFLLFINANTIRFLMNNLNEIKVYDGATSLTPVFCKIV